MDVSSYKIMKAYRKDGRLSFMLKLSLPRASDKSCEVFNSFYLKAADAYISLCVRLCRETEILPHKVAELFVSYTLSEVCGLFEIKRIYKLSGCREQLCGEESDFYDPRLDIFVKAPKNMKKQRIAPSRNGRKYNKTD